MPRKRIKFKVSRLTKPWALPGAESAIRALWGSGNEKFDIELEINKKPMLVRIRNSRGAWLKHLNKWVECFEENSAWDGSPEWLNCYVAKVTSKGVWFSYEEDWDNDSIHWVNFKKIKGYEKRIY